MYFDRANARERGEAELARWTGLSSPYGVNEMRQSSIIIHKGKREENYEIYIEDYVMSFLKGETGALNLTELYFYGFRENDNKRYIIYGAGRDKGLPVFDKYSLLDEIGCRLTQAGPVFLVREETGLYEIKGYEIFYQDNREMQSYLIDWKKESAYDVKAGKVDKTVRNVYIDETDGQKSGSRKAAQNTILHKSPYSAISVQLGIILVALRAIVINSTNSYDKMNQLNQSASEVFFAIENQEAEDVLETDEVQNEIVVERNGAQEDMQPDKSVNDAAVGDLVQEENVLKLVTLENEVQPAGSESGELLETEQDAEDAEETMADKDSSGESTASELGQQEENQGVDSDEPEEVEALSRNVARYYEVERGDTLYTISRKIYGDITHVQKICELNKISNPDHIRYGQKIILP